MNAQRHTSAYRTLLRAYPRSFRHDYGEPMTQLFADRVRDVGATAWLRVVPDLARTAPQQRIEAIMSHRSKGTTVLAIGTLGILLAFVVVGVGGPGGLLPVVAVIVALIYTQRRLFASMFGADRIPLRRAVTQTWWAPLAALMAATEIFFGTVNALDASNWGGRVFGSTILWAVGAAMLYGLTRRPFARTAGNTMILLASLPYFALFWAIVPPLMGLVLWTGVIRDGFDHERSAAPATS